MLFVEMKMFYLINFILFLLISAHFGVVEAFLPAAGNIYLSSPARYTDDESTTAECPVTFEKYGQTCLRMSTDFASYAAAEAMCLDTGGRLAAPKTPEIHSSIRQVAEKSRTGSYWIGLKKVKGIWTFSDRTPVSSYHKWFVGHPMVGPDYDCAVMSMRSNHTWLSAGCKWAWRYMCQFDLELPVELPNAKSGCDPNDLGLYNMFTTTTSVQSVGSAISVECVEGYASKKRITVECVTTNVWEAKEPCLRICLPPVVLHPNVLRNDVQSQFVSGDKASVNCQKGYSMEGSNDITCLPNGTWSILQGRCVKEAGDNDNNNDNNDNNNDNNNNDNKDNKDKSKREDTNNINNDRNVTVVDMQCPQVSNVDNNRLPDVTDTEFIPEGKSLLISCLQHFTIEPRSLRMSAKEWTWMKGQHIIEAPTDRKFPHVKIDDTGSLMILKMTKEVEGLYTCVSYVDEERELTYRSVYVALKGNCSMHLEIKPKDTIIFEGGYSILRCFAPDAIITWFKGILPLTDDDTHKILPNGALLIMNAKVSDTGTYECTAQHVRTRCVVSHSASVEVESALDVICGKPMTTNLVVDEDRGKIVGGEEVEKGSHPWMALIIGDVPRLNRRSTKVFCGGSLVNNHWVLSAAHCFRSVKGDDIMHLKIKLGKHDRTVNERDERVFAIQRVIVHPRFDEESFDNDIAVLRLADRAYYSNYILPVCLPFKGFMSQFYSFRKTMAFGYVAGWGQLTEAGLQPSELRAVRLPLINDALCKSSTSAVVTPNMFCAGYNQSTGDACKGDSGGPFEMTHDGKVYLAGVVSWGEGCARQSKYGYYVKIENYLDFIYSLIKE